MYISLKKLVLFTVTLHCPAVFWLSIETQLRVYIYIYIYIYSIWSLFDTVIFFDCPHQLLSSRASSA